MLSRRDFSRGQRPFTVAGLACEAPLRAVARLGRVGVALFVAPVLVLLAM